MKQIDKIGKYKVESNDEGKKYDTYYLTGANLIEMDQALYTKEIRDPINSDDEEYSYQVANCAILISESATQTVLKIFNRNSNERQGTLKLLEDAFA